MSLFTGAPASPVQFNKKLPTPGAINLYYQCTLGRKIDDDLAVSQFTRVLLEDLLHRFPASFKKNRPKVFVAGIPENVAIVSLVLLIRKDHAVGIDLMTIFQGQADLIVMNRLVSIALGQNLDIADDFSLSGHFLVETIGLMDTVRRTMNQLKVIRALVAPPDTVDCSLGYRIHDYIINIFPITG
jgi:hypothetical protein